jgi:hypothetical protein
MMESEKPQIRGGARFCATIAKARSKAKNEGKGDPPFDLNGGGMA